MRIDLSPADVELPVPAVRVADPRRSALASWVDSLRRIDAVVVDDGERHATVAVVGSAAPLVTARWDPVALVVHMGELRAAAAPFAAALGATFGGSDGDTVEVESWDQQLLDLLEAALLFASRHPTAGGAG